MAQFIRLRFAGDAEASVVNLDQIAFASPTGIGGKQTVVHFTAPSPESHVTRTIDEPFALVASRLEVEARRPVDRRSVGAAEPE